MDTAGASTPTHGAGVSTPMRGAGASTPMHNGGVSFWYASTSLPARRAGLPGDREADVCIVGAGFTGLWTAYYLASAQPGLRVAVCEAEIAGFGASGRNGGWLSAEIAFPADAGLRQAMIDSVDDPRGMAPWSLPWVICSSRASALGVAGPPRSRRTIAERSGSVSSPAIWTWRRRQRSSPMLTCSAAATLATSGSSVIS